MDIPKAMFDYARKNGHCELVINRKRNLYIRIAFDKNEDRGERKLYSYIALEQAVFGLDRRSQGDIEWIIRKYSPIKKNTFSLSENQLFKDFIVKNYHKYDNTGVNIF